MAWWASPRKTWGKDKRVRRALHTTSSLVALHPICLLWARMVRELSAEILELLPMNQALLFACCMCPATLLRARPWWHKVRWNPYRMRCSLECRLHRRPLAKASALKRPKGETFRHRRVHTIGSSSLASAYPRCISSLCRTMSWEQLGQKFQSHSCCRLGIRARLEMEKGRGEERASLDQSNRWSSPHIH